MNFEVLRDVMGKAIDFAGERGTKDQRHKIDLAVSYLSQQSGELEELLSGTRDQNRHPHHTPEDLKYSIGRNRRFLGMVCREILANDRGDSSR